MTKSQALNYVNKLLAIKDNPEFAGGISDISTDFLYVCKALLASEVEKEIPPDTEMCPHCGVTIHGYSSKYSCPSCGISLIGLS